MAAGEGSTGLVMGGSGLSASLVTGGGFPTGLATGEAFTKRDMGGSVMAAFGR